MVFKKGNKINLGRIGHHHSLETKKIMSEQKLENKNPQWKGDKVSIRELHNWIRRRKVKPSLCEKCNKNKPYELANISGNYKREVNDFRWECRSCHSKEHRGLDWALSMNKKRAIKINKLILYNNKTLKQLLKEPQGLGDIQ